MSKQLYFTEKQRKLANAAKAKRYYERNREKVCEKQRKKFRAGKKK